jgi:hypothetical protein
MRTIKDMMGASLGVRSWRGTLFRYKKQLILVHPSRMQMNDILQPQVQTGVRIVTERIQEAIDQAANGFTSERQ